MKIFIKNMVCNRCKQAVKQELEKAGLLPLSVELGEVELKEEQLTREQQTMISEALSSAGFELIDDKRSRIIEKVKNVVVSLVHHATEQPREKYSGYIAAQLHYDYPYISKLFSETEGITIEHYIIQQKVEKIKEYITYDELSLGEIAFRMGYSSTAHLSAQFKKITGLPPSHFRNIGDVQRKALDKVNPKVKIM